MFENIGAALLKFVHVASLNLIFHVEAVMFHVFT